MPKYFFVPMLNITLSALLAPSSIAQSETERSLPQQVAPVANSTGGGTYPNTVQEKIVRLTKHIEEGKDEHKLSDKEALELKHEEEALIAKDANLHDHEQKKSIIAREARLRDRLARMDDRVQAVRKAPGFVQ